MAWLRHDDEDGGGSHRRELIGPLLVKGVVVLLLALGGWAIYSQIGSGDSARQRFAQRVTIINQPPRKIEKPPEPEVKLEEIKVPKVEIARDTPQQTEAADQRLGVAEEGGAGGDAFGLAAKPAGRDIITLGNDQAKDGATGRLGYAFYTSYLQQQLQNEIAKRDRLRKGSYRVVLKLWIDDRGRVDRFEIVDSSGSQEMDQAIELAMTELPRLSQPPPTDMPQPVRVRMTSREVN